MGRISELMTTRRTVLKQLGLSATVLPFVSGVGAADSATSLLFEDHFKYTDSPLNHGWELDLSVDSRPVLETDGDILTMDAGDSNHAALYREISYDEPVAPHVEMQARSVRDYRHGEGKVRIIITTDDEPLASTEQRADLIFTEGNHDDILLVITPDGRETVRSSEVDTTEWQNMAVWFDGEKTYAGTPSEQFFELDISPGLSKDFRVYASNGSNVSEHDYVKVSRIRDTIAVDIDIKPDDDPDAINPKSKGEIPVAIHNTESFNPVTRVNVNSLRFGDPENVRDGGGASPSHGGHVEDVTGNGEGDLLLHFPTRETEFDGDEDSGRLEGETIDGTPLFGEDSVKIVGGGNGGNGNGNGNGGQGNGST